MLFNVPSAIQTVTKSDAIQAGTPYVLTLDVGGADKISLVVRNTGASAVNSVVVEKSPAGTTFGTDSALGSAIGSIAAGASVLVELEGAAIATLRLTLNSTIGTTFTLELQGRL